MGHAILALSLVALDGFVYGQGFSAMLALLATAVVFFPLWLSARGEDAALARRRGLRALAYGLAGAAVLAFLAWDRAAAEGRARTVVAACRAFKARTGAYPASLSELVPTELPSVPRARRTLVRAEFLYSSSPEDHRLTWVVVPPFGRRWVRLEDGKTGSLD